MRIISACAINFLILSLLISTVTLANNLTVTSVTLVGQVPASDYTFVQFDITWDNSWRVSTAPFNYDAVWVFVKYKDGSGLWKHATLNTSGHSVTTDNGVTSEFISATDGTGVFIQRSGNGTGSINWDGVKLRWNYGADGLADDANVTVKVFVIEMVYIPQGSFNVGDGTATQVQGQLHNANSTSTPFNITSEGSITLGGTTSGQLGNNNTVGMATVDDFNDVTTKTLPAAFPKGSAAFYIMKYEITQGQYVEFLNCLTRTQQNTRTQTDISVTNITNRYVMSGTDILSRRNGIRCDADLGGTTDPITLYNDLDGDGFGDEANDGQHIACNFIYWMDGAAYADWAGLRPFTELEYEKACRGKDQSSVANEYAWGNASIYGSTGYEPLSNPGETNELPLNPSTGSTGNCAYNGFATGPFRSGIFATSSSNRITSGAGYYGVMEMSGNLFERCVSIGSSTGRSFTGTHGDGNLSSSGNGNNSDWPGYDGSEITGATGDGFRGGCWGFSDRYARVSDRGFAVFADTAYDDQNGYRCSRSEP